MVGWLHGYFRGQGDIGGFGWLGVINGLGCRRRVSRGAVRGTVRIIILRWGWLILWHRGSWWWRSWGIFWHCRRSSWWWSWGWF